MRDREDNILYRLDKRLIDAYTAAYSLIYLTGRPRGHGAVNSFAYIAVRRGLLRDHWGGWHPTIMGVTSPAYMSDLAVLAEKGLLVDTGRGLALPPQSAAPTRLLLVSPSIYSDPVGAALRLYYGSHMR